MVRLHRVDVEFMGIKLSRGLKEPPRDWDYFDEMRR